MPAPSGPAEPMTRTPTKTSMRTRTTTHADPRGDEALVVALRAALPPDRVHTDDLERTLYGRDASLMRGETAAVCFPLSAAEVQACVRTAVAFDRPFVPRGAGTGLAGGAVPRGRPVVIVTTKMNRSLDVDLDERGAWVEPGVINLDLSRELRPPGFHF